MFGIRHWCFSSGSGKNGRPTLGWICVVIGYFCFYAHHSMFRWPLQSGMVGSMFRWPLQSGMVDKIGFYFLDLDLEALSVASSESESVSSSRLSFACLGNLWRLLAESLAFRLFLTILRMLERYNNASNKTEVLTDILMCLTYLNPYLIKKTTT